jgi:uncharacterized protein (DUF362 family)
MRPNPVIVCDLNVALHNLPDLSSRAGFRLEETKLALIKPNLCGYYHPSLDLLSKIVEFLLSGAESVAIGETRSMDHDPEDQFRKFGIYDLLERLGRHVKAVDLSEDEWTKIRVSNPHALGEINLPKKVLDSDVLVNVPKFGHHYATGITCALKNLFGLLPEKHKFSVYHPLGMDRVIADIAQVIRPNLNVVDVENKIILGVDALAVDVVACRFADLDPVKVEHLRLVSEDRDERLEDFLKELTVTKV